MKVIITKTGKLENVSDGYARNYLLPKGLATVATREGVQHATAQEQHMRQAEQNEQQQWVDMCATLPTLTCTVSAPANADGTLFGALKESVILQAFNTQHAFPLKREWLRIAEPIKHVGAQTVAVTFPNRMQTTFQLNVVQQ